MWLTCVVTAIHFFCSGDKWKHSCIRNEGFETFFGSTMLSVFIWQVYVLKFRVNWSKITVFFLTSISLHINPSTDFVSCYFEHQVISTRHMGLTLQLCSEIILYHNTALNWGFFFLWNCLIFRVHGTWGYIYILYINNQFIKRQQTSLSCNLHSNEWSYRNYLHALQQPIPGNIGHKYTTQKNCH